ncbi:MAG: DUF4336 domain-containing protein [Polyangiaceae bacterium]|nr:DUF4336 domain-containing protein [Polyangiaceae bacterium]
MLEPWSESIWIATRPVKFLGVETGSRMTVVKLSSGGLFVHSPVALDAQMRRDVDALGEVRAVVAPSLFHHLYVGAWMAAYPKAIFAACQGLDWKRPDLAFTCVLGDTPHEAWAKELQQVYFSARRENEVVFYDARSKTMICADALLNLSKHPSATTKIVARLMWNDAPGTGYLERVMVRDRRVARRQVDRILEWAPERIILSHGGLVHEDGTNVIRHAYAWV